MYGMDEVAAEVWGWIQEPRSLDELVTLLTDAYDVDESTAREDLRGLLAEFTRRNLI